MSDIISISYRTGRNLRLTDKVHHTQEKTAGLFSLTRSEEQGSLNLIRFSVFCASCSAEMPKETII